MSRDGRKNDAKPIPKIPLVRPILGIDPGLQRTGYAFLTSDQTPGERRAPAAETIGVLEAGVIRLNPKQPLEMRLLELERSLEHLIAQHRPVCMAVEQLYAHYKHPRTAIIMGHARGVILALAARAGLNVIHVAATHVKKHLTGSGHASKAQIQRAIAATLRLPCIPEPNDVADALAVAFCALRMHQSENMGGPPTTTVAADPSVGRSPVAADPSVGRSPVAADPRVGRSPVAADPSVGRSPVAADPVMRSSSFATSDPGAPAGASSLLPSPEPPPNICRSPKSKRRPVASFDATVRGGST